MAAIFSQFFPSAPTFDETSFGPQAGKVALVTGGYGGIGIHICSILYHLGARIIMTGRSQAEGDAAIAAIKSEPTPKHAAQGGQLEFLAFDLSDMRSVMKAAETLRARAPKLDLLFNNAGVAHPPADLKSPQGVDLSIATNILGPFLLTKTLFPSLQAAEAPRIIWVASLAVETAPQGGLSIQKHLETPFPDPTTAYSITKLACWYLAAECPRRFSSDQKKITSIAVNPGNNRTASTRHLPWALKTFMYYVSKSPKLGALNEIWAALSPEVTPDRNGEYVVPYGRWHPAPREDLVKGMKPLEGEGSTQSSEIWDWCEKSVLSLVS